MTRDTLPHVLYATTNGTLVHGEIRRWLTKHKHHFYAGLSIDGTRSMHDRNRSNSFDRIDVRFFQKTWPDQAVKMTISPVTIGNTAEGIIFLHRRGFIVEPGFAQGIDWKSAETIKVLEEQLRRLVQFYLDNPRIKPCSFLFPEFAAIGRSTEAGQKLTRARTKRLPKWCGIGTNLIAVDCDGSEYPCHFLMPFSIGPTPRAVPIHQYEDAATLQDAGCRGCPILPVCPTCYASNLLERGNPATRDRSLCDMTKLRMQAASYLVGRMLCNRRRYSAVADLDRTQTALTILGIEAVQDLG